MTRQANPNRSRQRQIALRCLPPLAQLGELKASGVLSEAEFEEQKKKLLAQL